MASAGLPETSKGGAMRRITSWAMTWERSAPVCTTGEAREHHGGMRPWIRNPWVPDPDGWRRYLPANAAREHVMDAAQLDHLVADIYAELKAQAARASRRKPGEPSPTSLVHETVLRLYRQQPDRWRDERHFRATASIALKQVFLDSLRHRRAIKRGGDAPHVSLDDVNGIDGFDGLDTGHELIAISEVLDALEVEAPRTAQVVAMKVFGELENQEVADALKVSRATVDREWRAARALLASWHRGA